MRIAQEAMPQDSSQYINESCCLEIKIIRANFIQLRIRNKLQVDFEMMKHQQTTNHIGMNIHSNMYKSMYDYQILYE